jgi:hypothetical protein
MGDPNQSTHSFWIHNTNPTRRTTINEPMCLTPHTGHIMEPHTFYVIT